VVRDPLRDEPVNIGVIMLCGDMVWTRFLRDLRVKLGPGLPVVEEQVIRAYVREWQRQLAHKGSQFFTRLVAERDFGKLRLTEPRAGLTAEPSREIDHLYRLFMWEE